MRSLSWRYVLKQVARLSKGAIESWEQYSTSAAALEAEIVLRIDYILTFLLDEFGCTLNNWFFDDAAEGQVGHLCDHMSFDYTSITGIELSDCDNFPDDLCFIDKDGDEFYWQSEIPARWLTEDFEQEIIDGRTKLEEKEAARKLKLKERRDAKSAKSTDLFEKAKSKLTKEEFLALTNGQTK